MDSLKISNWMLAAALSVTTVMGAQTGAQPGTHAEAQPGRVGAPQTPAAPAQKPASPLQLQDMGQTPKADPFPPVNQKYFTATSPTGDTVNSFLKALWG